MSRRDMGWRLRSKGPGLYRGFHKGMALAMPYVEQNTTGFGPGGNRILRRQESFHELFSHAKL